MKTILEKIEQFLMEAVVPWTRWKVGSYYEIWGDEVEFLGFYKGEGRNKVTPFSVRNKNPDAKTPKEIAGRESEYGAVFILENGTPFALSYVKGSWVLGREGRKATTKTIDG